MLKISAFYFMWNPEICQDPPTCGQDDQALLMWKKPLGITYLWNIQTEPLDSLVNISIISWIQSFMQSQTGIVNWYWDMFRLDQSSKKRCLPKIAIVFLKQCYSYFYICPHHRDTKLENKCTLWINIVLSSLSKSVKIWLSK